MENDAVSGMMEIGPSEKESEVERPVKLTTGITQLEVSVQDEVLVFGQPEPLHDGQLAPPQEGAGLVQVWISAQALQPPLTGLLGPLKQVPL